LQSCLRSTSSFVVIDNILNVASKKIKNKSVLTS
jgi:hypothetical protein